MQLTKILQIRSCDVVARQMQKRIDQHGAMAVGHHKAVTINPVWIGWIVNQKIVPENFSYIRHSHWRPGMTGFCLLYRICAEYTDGVGELLTVRG